MKPDNIDNRIRVKGAIFALLTILWVMPILAQEKWQAPSGHFLGVGMRDENTIIAVGEFGKILVGTDGGRHWSFRSAPTKEKLSSVAFGNRTSGIIVGDSGVILRTTDGGDTWMRVADTGRSYLFDVCAVSPDEYFAVGLHGSVLHSIDGGARWSVIPVPTAANLYRTVFKSRRSAIIIGDSGTTLLSEDGGASWTKGPIPDPAWYFSCAFSDSLHGVIVGQQGVIDVTSDGGHSWTPAQIVPSDNDLLRDVCYLSKDTVIAVGRSRGASKIIRSVDGGRRWDYDEPPGMQRYGGVMALTHDGRGNVFAVGLDHLILSSTDRGTSWETISSMPTSTVGANAEVRITQVGWADSLHLFAIGDAGTRGSWAYSSMDGGITWRGVQVDSYEEATGLIVVSKDTLVAMSFPNSQNYVSTDGGQSWDNQFFITIPDQAGFFPGRTLMLTDSIGYNFAADSLIWRTTDRGTTWYGYPLETRFWYMLPCKESFPTLDIGYVVGQGIDSFTPLAPSYGGIYKSIDSGKSWQPQIVRTIPAMYGICFRTPMFGVACGDSGTIMRTVDGGEHWQRVHSDDSMNFGDLLLLDDTLGYAVGQTREKRSVLFKTNDGGQSWNEVDIGTRAGDGLSFYNIFSSDGRHICLVGTNTMLLSQPDSSEAPAEVAGKTPRPGDGGLSVQAVARDHATTLELDWSTFASRQVRISIYDDLGRLMFRDAFISDLRHRTIDIGSFSSGQYFAVVDGDSERAVAGFVVVR